jgi:hypothetical protein
MRLAVSSLKTIFTCLWVGSPRTRVRVVCGICALMLSADTVLDMFDVVFS